MGGWTTGSMTLLLGGLLTACSAKSAERAEAGAHGRDAGPEASPLQAGDAGSDGAVKLDAFTMPDEGVHPAPESGPPPCYGPSTCPVAQLCCAALAAEKPAASCIVAASCPSGLVEVCGKTGNETCSTGKCEEYQCKVGQVTSDIYACKEPFSHGVVCGLVPDGGFPGDT
jgi:hypothetical protein